MRSILDEIAVREFQKRGSYLRLICSAYRKPFLARQQQICGTKALDLLHVDKYTLMAAHERVLLKGAQDLLYGKRGFDLCLFPMFVS